MRVSDTEQSIPAQYSSNTAATAPQVSNRNSELTSMDKSLFDYSARNKDGSKDVNGKATISYDDFSEEELAQTNSQNMTFKEAISSLIGKCWEVAGPLLDNLRQIFLGKVQTEEETVNGHKVGERNGNKVWCNDGKYHKANDTYEKDGITYMINENLAIIASGSKGSKIEYFKDGYRVTQDNGDNEFTIKAYRYKDNKTLTSADDVKSLMTDDPEYEVETYNNGAAQIRLYQDDSIKRANLRNQDGVPVYRE